MDADTFHAPESHTVEEAAEILGLTPGRVRQLLRDEDLDGTPPTPGSGQRGWRVSAASVRERLSKQQPRAEPPPPGDQRELVELLRAQVEDLRAERDAWRDQARRSDYMAQSHFDRTRELESRLRELEAPAYPDQPPDEAESAGDASSKGPIPPERETATETRPWWRRVFGS